MPDFPTQDRAAKPLFIHAGGMPYGTMHEMFGVTGSGNNQPGARTWVAKLVAYVPVFLPFNYPVQRVFWVNGSTVTSSNADFGIYSADGTRLYNTGSTALSGASAAQYVTPATPFMLSAGLYYFAYSCDSGSASRALAFAGNANGGRMIGLLEETTGSFGLPATMTPVAWARGWGTHVMGITRTPSGF